MGGECGDDSERLREDPGLSEMIGHGVPSPAVARKFLNQFHEEAKIEAAKQGRRGDQIAYIPEENEALQGLGLVNRALVQELGRRCPKPKNLTIGRVIGRLLDRAGDYERLLKSIPGWRRKACEYSSWAG